MFTLNGITGAIVSRKRPTDDSSDPENGEVSLESTPAYDVEKEHMPSSLLQSKAYALYKYHERGLKQLLRGPLANAGHINKSLQGLVKDINEKIDGAEPQKIVLCLIGPMGVG